MTTPLTDLLDQQAAQLDELLTLQHHEKELLVKRDAPALDTLTQQKEQLLDAIQATDTAIASHPQHGTLSSEPKLQAKRQAIVKQVESCQAKNDVNGQLVRTTLGRVQQLKQTLQANQTGTTITYTSKGKTSSGPSGSSIKA